MLLMLEFVRRLRNEDCRKQTLMEAHERERLLVDQSLRDLSVLFLLLAFSCASSSVFSTASASAASAASSASLTS